LTPFGAHVILLASQEAQMLRPTKKTKFTPAEYLAMEQAADYKSEYYAGEIFAMSGGTADHSVIQGNWIAALNQQLSATPCRVFTSDMRLLVERSSLYTYPDAMVVCGKIEFVERRKDTLTNPLLIVEVLSESTRDYDRGAKFDFYKQVLSLQEYVLVESENARVEVYRRVGETWTMDVSEGLDGVIRLQSVECEIPAAQIYAKVMWNE
jgi:Uma2 family endonuclease